MAIKTVEDRLAVVEKEIEKLKERLHAEPLKDDEPKWKQIVGVFKDDPLFDEAERLGREWRESQRMDYDDDAHSFA